MRSLVGADRCAAWSWASTVSTRRHAASASSCTKSASTQRTLCVTLRASSSTTGSFASTGTVASSRDGNMAAAAQAGRCATSTGQTSMRAEADGARQKWQRLPSCLRLQDGALTAGQRAASQCRAKRVAHATTRWRRRAGSRRSAARSRPTRASVRFATTTTMTIERGPPRGGVFVGGRTRPSSCANEGRPLSARKAALGPRSLVLGCLGLWCSVVPSVSGARWFASGSGASSDLPLTKADRALLGFGKAVLSSNHPPFAHY
mmetsp:Transcript_22148/g.47826  ORF Transcript_22148/g.47826 Transcript_22148/m.47826 type:complete len:262 (+) Transcript_22148:192-977(+)